MNMAEGKRRFFDFVEALEEERCKIQMFSRELPLCLQLVNEAIDSLRRQIASEEPFSDKPALENFMPIKSNSFSSRSSRDLNHEKGASDCKLDWLRSVHIRGLAVTEAPAAETGTLRKPLAVNATRVSGAFQPFERNKAVPAIPVPFAAPAVSSTTTTTMGGRQDGGGEVEEEDRQSLGPPINPNRKQRRCWSPDLHRKFLSALEELGGSHAATPKQIREMMKVDNLTNDEVKSHLQKYRLHTRRPATTVQSTGSNGTRSPPHFVLLGSIWVPPHEYVMGTAQPAEVSSAALNETFSPEASLPLELGLQEEQSTKKQLTNQPAVMPKHSLQVFSQDDDSLLDDSATNSNSCTASFFSQTTTASPLSCSEA